jgi:transcriptional regulator with XRE-family HTH domain
MEGLKKTRIEKSLTRKQVSDITGITLANQSQIERGIQIPDITTRQKLENFYGVRINFLDTDSINSEPREIPCSWNDTEREFRFFIHMISSLPIEERRVFIQSIVKHLNKLKK